MTSYGVNLKVLKVEDKSGNQLYGSIKSTFFLLKSLGRLLFFRGDPLSAWLGPVGGQKKVPSNQLKIMQLVGIGYAQIATRGFCARQNSYGFRAI